MRPLTIYVEGTHFSELPISRFSTYIRAWLLFRKMVILPSQEVGRNTRIHLVFLPTLLSCFSRFLRALQQNRQQTRLLYLLTNLRDRIVRLTTLSK